MTRASPAPSRAVRRSCGRATRSSRPACARAHTRDEAIGRDLADLILPERLREAHRANLTRYLATGETRLIGRRIEVMALRRNGEEFPVEVAITVTPADV